MKQSRRTVAQKDPPVFRTLVAVFAILLNTAFPAGRSLAAAAAPDSPTRDYVICLASGGTTPAPLGRKAPAQSDEDRPHCPQCRPPGTTVVRVPVPDDAFVPHRIAAPVVYVAMESPDRSVHAAAAFEARAPPG
jgi:hypothetical protein